MHAIRRIHSSVRCSRPKPQDVDSLLNSLLGRTADADAAAAPVVPTARSWAAGPTTTTTTRGKVPSFAAARRDAGAGNKERESRFGLVKRKGAGAGNRSSSRVNATPNSNPNPNPNPRAVKPDGPRKTTSPRPSLAESAAGIDVGPMEDVEVEREHEGRRKHARQQSHRRGGSQGRGSLRDVQQQQQQQQQPPPPPPPPPPPARRKTPKPIHTAVVVVDRQVFIPPSVRVGDLARIVDQKLPALQRKMQRIGMTPEQTHSDYLLSAEDASLVAMEYNLTPIVDAEKSFDIYPDPPPTAEQMALLPSRPPVVTIMGHVDHGKTTLLDALRHTSVAAGEAGGITQHIGAFSVPLLAAAASASASASASGPDEAEAAAITFLDTPGHAAFTAMRARGAHVTDIVVLVVAADDGVMPQTREVIELVKAEGEHIGLVVAINKCDKPAVDIHRVKNALMVEGVYLEEDGGDVPSVQVSGLHRIGLDELVETLATVAEVRDLRASRTSKAEGFVLESRVEKGRGNVATVLITRGTLRTGDAIVAGQTWCRVRQMTDDKARPVKEALPGMPVIVTGWKDVPSAGDEILQAPNEEDAKRAVANRRRDAERKALMADVERINEKRRLERERIEQDEAIADAAKAEGVDPVAATAAAHRQSDNAPTFRELRLVIRADVSGTVEAVVGALEHIGNKEAGVKIIHAGVGDVAESDVAIAEAAQGMIIGFSVKAAKSVTSHAAKSNVPIHLETVIYRLIETVRAKVASLLPPVIETRVLGEATVLQMFSIAVKGKESASIAGCRVSNGVIGRHDLVRVLRGEERQVIFDGTLDSLKHVKKDISEARKGSECGLSVHGFKEIKDGDVIVAYQKVEKPREL